LNYDDDSGNIARDSVLNVVNGGAIAQALRCVWLQAEGLWLQLPRGMRAAPPTLLVQDFWEELLRCTEVLWVKVSRCEVDID
jgi:hypothetical protein